MIIECTSSTVASFSNSFLVISTLPARVLSAIESLDAEDPGGEGMDGRATVVEGGAVEAAGGGPVVGDCGSAGSVPHELIFKLTDCDLNIVRIHVL